MAPRPADDGEQTLARFRKLLEFSFAGHDPGLPGRRLEERARFRLQTFGPDPAGPDQTLALARALLPDPSGDLPPALPFIGEVPDTAALLAGITAALLRAGESRGETDAALDFLQKRFEVSKGLFACYPAPRETRCLLLDPATYARLALALLLRFAETRNPNDLSTALKVLDLVIAAQEIPAPPDCAPLRAALAVEALLLGELHAA